MMNPNLSFDDWLRYRNLDSGMYGPLQTASGFDPNEPENPSETMVRPRIVELRPGQIIFRWVDRRSGTVEQKAAGPWWSTPQSVRQILKIAEAAQLPGTSEAARIYSKVARGWSALDQVVVAEVTQSIRCFMGMGRDIHDPKHRETWRHRGIQLYIPNLAVRVANNYFALSPEAKLHLHLRGVCLASSFDKVYMQGHLA